MPKKRKPSIPTPTSPKGFGRIPTATAPKAGLVKFSFKYTDFPPLGEKFTIADREPAYYQKLLERLKDLSNKTVSELRSSIDKTLRFHPIDWDDKRVSEDGFRTLPATTREEVGKEACQFSISSNEHGRVHGFILDDVFYIVWWDPQHQLYH